MSKSPIMQRRHFQAIADVLKAYSDEAAAINEPTRKAHAEEIAARFADALRSTNPQFDRERFLKASGADRIAG